MKGLKIIEGYRYFDSQADDEVVLLVLRKYWLVFFAPFFYGLISATAVVALWLILFKQTTTLFLNPNIEGSIVAFVILFALLYSFTAWLVRYLNVLILTNENIVDIKQLSLFGRQTSILQLENIEDVSVQRKGLFQNIFNYGGILIQTAGEQNNFVIEKIPDPESVLKQIMDEKEKVQEAIKKHR